MDPAKHLTPHGATTGEKKMSRMEAELKSWRHTLESKPDLAKTVLENLKLKLRNNKTSDPFSFNRAISRVQQGVETPQDYGLNY